MRLDRKDKERFGGNRAKTLLRDNYRCQFCGMTDTEHRERWRRGLTVDHIDGIDMIALGLALFTGSFLPVDRA